MELHCSRDGRIVQHMLTRWDWSLYYVVGSNAVPFVEEFGTISGVENCLLCRLMLPRRDLSMFELPSRICCDNGRVVGLVDSPSRII